MPKAIRKPATATPLDRIDRAIVSELQKNARLSNKELAARVGVAPSTCSERVRRLEDERVLTGFHASVEPAALGIGLEAMIAIRLSRHERSQVEQFWEHARGMEEVVDTYHVAGSNDFLVHVVVRNADHLRDLAVSGFTTRPEVAHIETSLIFEHVRNPIWPDVS